MYIYAYIQVNIPHLCPSIGAPVSATVNMLIAYYNVLIYSYFVTILFLKICYCSWENLFLISIYINIKIIDSL